MQEVKPDLEGDPSRTPSSHRQSNHLGRYAMYDLDGDGHVTMEEVVRATFKNLFPDSFQSVLEVRNHKVHACRHVLATRGMYSSLQLLG